MSTHVADEACCRIGSPVGGRLGVRTTHEWSDFLQAREEFCVDDRRESATPNLDRVPTIGCLGTCDEDDCQVLDGWRRRRLVAPLENGDCRVACDGHRDEAGIDEPAYSDGHGG